MNEQNVKALFFSQYIGQKTDNSGAYATVSGTMVDFISIGVGDCAVLLRSVSQLTDDEGLNIDIIWGYGKTANSEHGKKLGLWIVNNSRSLYPDISFRVFQYLLRIGILLHFTYLNENNQPVTLQPEEIVQRGWAKTL